jgi:purine-binding chemotaxis protein CheW
MHDAEKHFVFVHGERQYALPVLDVLEIVETPSLLPAHGDMPAYLGNVSHRGRLLPVLDPTRLTGRCPVAVSPTAKMQSSSTTFVLVHRDDTFFGLAMDRFVGVVPLETAPGSGPKGDPGNNGADCVDVVRAFREDALISLAPASLAELVKRSFQVQQAHGLEQAQSPGQVLAELDKRIYLCARIDRPLFAIPVEKVSEVIEGHDVTPLFKMPPLVRGLINLRGQVVACIDVSLDLGFPPRTLEERSQFVVLESDGATAALCVDRVAGIRLLAPESFQKADLVLSGELTRYATGVLEEKDGPVLGLSVQAIFDAPALQSYRRQEG